MYYVPTLEHLAAFTNEQLVSALVRTAGDNNESDCREALAAYRGEVLRRLEKK